MSDWDRQRPATCRAHPPPLSRSGCSAGRFLALFLVSHVSSATLPGGLMFLWKGKGEVLYLRTYCCMISLASPRCAVAAVGDTGEREEYTDFRKHHAANMRSYYQYEACGCQKTRGSTKIYGQLYLCCCRGLTIKAANLRCVLGPLRPQISAYYYQGLQDIKQALHREAIPTRGRSLTVQVAVGKRLWRKCSGRTRPRKQPSPPACTLSSLLYLKSGRRRPEPPSSP